ncbi:MAG: acyl-CoA synthetase [Candidatus Accumulibacter sp.]|uniref:AMP-binding protein n=1 Tax=Accumulibacter sp. TaxID=2053492 RepID=UPI00258A0ECE|nr:AMP-binding protein [Accumulibacter sp.]MBK8115742.1 acyl-CoA synthetase [Accumulibacter sp.]
MELDSQAGSYQELCRSFRWRVPERFNLAVDVCGRWAAERHRFALYYEDASGFTSAHTFWDIQRQANRLSNVLAALGTLPGDRVAILLPQCPEAAIAQIAICQMGALAVLCRRSWGRIHWNTVWAMPPPTWPSSMRRRSPECKGCATGCRGCDTCSALAAPQDQASGPGMKCSSTLRRTTRR